MKNGRTLTMKILSMCGVLAAGLITCFAGTADAGLVAPGSSCVGTYFTNENSVYRSSGWAGNNETTGRMALICPLSVDHTIGPSADFTIVVDDQRSDDFVSCAGLVADPQGNIIGSAAGTMDTTALETGVKTLTGSVTVTPSTTNNYVVYCELPLRGASRSYVRTIKVE